MIDNNIVLTGLSAVLSSVFTGASIMAYLKWSSNSLITTEVDKRLKQSAELKSIINSEIKINDTVLNIQRSLDTHQSSIQKSIEVQGKDINELKTTYMQNLNIMLSQNSKLSERYESLFEKLSDIKADISLVKGTIIKANNEDQFR